MSFQSPFDKSAKPALDVASLLQKKDEVQVTFNKDVVKEEVKEEKKEEPKVEEVKVEEPKIEREFTAAQLRVMNAKPNPKENKDFATRAEYLEYYGQLGNIPMTSPFWKMEK